MRLHERVGGFRDVGSRERSREVLLRAEGGANELGRLDPYDLLAFFFEKNEPDLGQGLKRRAEAAADAPGAIRPALPFALFGREKDHELVALARGERLEDNGFSTVGTHALLPAHLGPTPEYGTRMNETVFVHPTEARRRFEEFAMRELTNDDLLEGSLLIALEEYPQLDLDRYKQRVESLIDRVRDRLSAGEPDIFRLGHVHAVLFDDEGYIGNVGDYFNDRNSFINEVMDRKLGIPISLSILFLTVARRIGLDAHGVGLPGHFLAKVQFELSEVYVDSFYGGQTMTVAEIADFLSEMSGGEFVLRSDYLRAWNPRQTLSRVLANLYQIFEQRGDARRAMAAAERIEILGADLQTVSQ